MINSNKERERSWLVKLNSYQYNKTRVVSFIFLLSKLQIER